MVGIMFTVSLVTQHHLHVQSLNVIMNRNSKQKENKQWLKYVHVSTEVVGLFYGLNRSRPSHNVKDCTAWPTKMAAPFSITTCLFKESTLGST